MPVTIADPRQSPLYPQWLKPENASVFDPAIRSPLRVLVSLLGLDDPTQIMNIGIPLETGAMTGGAIDLLAQKFPRFAKVIKAYHGSPHNFEKFDTSKIGTGEGAQVYGHGLYFAENPAVAGEYAKNVIDTSQFDTINKRLSELGKVMERDSIGGQYRKFRTPVGEDAAVEYDRLMLERANIKGKTYEVAIKADPEQFLDWDKPLSEQPAVKSVLQNAPNAKPIDRVPWRDDAPGSEAIRALEQRYGSRAAAAQALKDAGVPGIKYLDQGSRGPSVVYDVGAPRADFGPYSPYTNRSDAERQLKLLRQHGFHDAEIKITQQPQTHNYVVFDDKTVEILKKYGLFLPLAGAAQQQQMAMVPPE